MSSPGKHIIRATGTGNGVEINTPTVLMSGSFIVSGSFNVSGSLLVNGTTPGGSSVKSDSVSNSSFSGTPRTAAVTFGTAFSDTNYAITITGEDARSWTIQSKTASGFTINSNSSVALTGTTYWIATAYNNS